MNWHQTFPRSNDPDYLEADRRMRQSVRPEAAPSKKDIEQDAVIRSLERECRELRIYTAALIRLLTKNQTIDAKEVDALVALADRVQRDIPAQDYRDHRQLRDLIRPPQSDEQSQ